jgi:hypothetical protein
MDRRFWKGLFFLIGFAKGICAGYATGTIANFDFFGSALVIGGVVVAVFNLTVNA